MPTTIDRKQTEMAGMPQTALGRYAEDYCEQKERIAEQKEKLGKIGEDIVRVMRKENRREFTINHDGVRYRFEVVDGAEKLKCVKAKSPAE